VNGMGSRGQVLGCFFFHPLFSHFLFFFFENRCFKSLAFSGDGFFLSAFLR